MDKYCKKTNHSARELSELVNQGDIVLIGLREFENEKVGHAFVTERQVIFLSSKSMQNF
jgi:hypothetical protein